MNVVVSDIVTELKEILVKLFIGDCVIALAGAHAKGVEDINSDIDLFAFINGMKAYEEVFAIIQEIADKNERIYISKSYMNAPWGGSIDFYYKGIPIEVAVKDLEAFKKQIDLSMTGKFDIIPATWTSNGYYTYICLCEVSFLIPIYDKLDFISNYQAKTSQYQIPLKKTIINTFYNRAKTWIRNFHYTSAIKRADLLFISPIILHTILDIIQVIFALNEHYYPGDKKLVSELKKLNYCPDILIQNVKLLLQASDDYDVLMLQKGLLEKIMDDIKNEIIQQKII